MENEYWTSTKKLLAEEKDLSTFKCWATLLSIPLYSYEEGLVYYMDSNAKLLENRTDVNIWLAALQEPQVGHTSSSYKVSRRIFFNVECSPWTLKTVNHLLAYESMSEKSIHDYEQIVDFGAGIGETCRVLRKVGYKGDLYICDLPEISRISSFYLNAYGMKFTTVDDYKLIPKNKKTLFIATWSLSEVPYKFRNEIAKHFQKQDFFIIYQNKVFGYDNEKYFKEEFSKKAKVACQFSELLLSYPEEEQRSFMLVGTKDNG